MSKVLLPGDQWLILRDPDDLTERQTRRVANLLGRLSPEMKQLLATNERARVEGEPSAEEALGLMIQANEQDMETFDQLADAMAVALIESWSWPFEPSMDTLPDLPRRAYKAVQTAVAPFLGAFMGLNVEPGIDPDSPS